MSKGKGHVPVRMCICCRTKQKKGDLIRLILNDKGEVVRDDEHKAPGRGAYVCNNETCRSHPKMEGYLKRAFKTGDPVINCSGLLME
ncbi:MAG: YlxR family protein [Desulfatiglandaceae bacterium]